MVFAAGGSRLYLSEWDGDQLWAFAVDGTGGLPPVDDSPWTMAGVASSAGIELTRGGTLLLNLDSDNDVIAVFTVASDGSINAVTNSPFALDATDPDPSGFVIAR